MNYFPLTDEDREGIRQFLGIRETRELFSDLPQKQAYFPLDDLPSALPEDQLSRRLQNLADANTYSHYLSFLGAGAYDHFIPEVAQFLSGKSEFLTPYTPYQAEVSQGSLQGIFEYQTMICQLTGMDVANSSLYDGGTAAAEGVLLAIRKTRRNRILVSSQVHPESVEIIRTYLANLGMELEMVHTDPMTGTTDMADLDSKMNANTAGYLFQSPNFLGQIEPAAAISERVHQDKGVSIQAISEAFSLALLLPPGENGVDIALGEAQSFGLPLAFGGPYLGFLATRQDFLRQLPGRLVGQTQDVDGKRGYVLTLSTREQHIKREKATSNICSNQAWCAMRAAMTLATLGKTGLRDLATQSHQAAAYFLSRLSTQGAAKARYTRNRFNEVVLEFHRMDAETALAKLKQEGILAGVPLSWFQPEEKNAILVAFTEKHRPEHIDRLIQALGGLQ